MDISVIVPIYGVEKYIEKCLRSLFEQTKTDSVEFILVNDCTPDSSMTIAHRVVSEFPNLCIRVENMEQNSGSAAVRQRGIDVSGGDYVINIDSDDWVEPNMLEELWDEVIRTSAEIVVCDMYINKDDTIRYLPLPISGNSKDAVRDILLKENSGIGMTTNKLVKKALYSQNNIRYIAGINYSEDLIICIKLFSYATNISYTPKAYYHYRYNPMSMMNNREEYMFARQKVLGYDVIHRFIKYLFDKELDNELFDMMLHYKFSNLKANVGRIKKQKYFAKILQDCNSHIFKSKRILGLHNKLAFLFACNGLLPLANVVWFTVKIKDKIRKIK